MRVLFANVPFIKRDGSGQIRTGPNAGSRWPWTLPGITEYACFPFFMAYAVQYLRLHGVDAGFYDAVALHHWDHEVVKQTIARCKPEILFLETSTPMYRTIREFATWAKERLGARIVLTGPHVQAFAGDLMKEAFVDHCVIGEYEAAALEIASDPTRAKPLYTFDLLSDINLVKGENFVPFRPLDYLFNYWEPTMNTRRPQLAVSTSRGCPFKCTYCQWPKVMNDGRYRARDPELVIDEIRSVISSYRRAQSRPQAILSSGRNELECAWRGQQSFRRAVKRVLDRREGEIRSLLFDDDTWNLGASRIKALCRGLKDIGLPWTMMGRIDTSSPALYDEMVDCGCVGMRFGVESFSQRLLDNTKKRLDARVSYDNIRYLLTHFSNMEFHFTTMKNLPGEVAADWEADLAILNDLQELGRRSGNIVHWQNSDCVAFPGTELWEEMVARGDGNALQDFDLYDGHPDNEVKLAETVGWLGEAYRPSYSAYSKAGSPTDLPED